MTEKPFSKRHGFKVEEKEITIRQDAPTDLREFIIQALRSLGYGPKFIREVLCRVLKKVPDRDNWSEYPNIFNECVDLISECRWYFVYDIIEAFYKAVDISLKENYTEEINDFFKANGIGWKLNKGLIEFRGDESFEIELQNTTKTLENAKQKTAKTEIKEALNDLSRRPEPDITGAIQHSVACLECVARTVSGNDKMTLGDLIKKHSTIVPRPLDEAISKVWGYSSEQGRHLREGGNPTYEEAELVVGLSAVLSNYLGKKLPPQKEDNFDAWL